MRTPPLRVAISTRRVAYLPVTRAGLRDLLNRARRAGRHSTVIVAGHHVPIHAIQRALEQPEAA